MQINTKAELAEDSPAWGRGPFTTMVKVPGLKAGRSSSFVLIGGLGERNQNFHFGVVGLKSAGVSRAGSGETTRIVGRGR